MRRDDGPEIKRALNDRLESLVGHYFPGAAIRAGSAYPEPKDARDLGSFQIYLTGPHRGEWYRRSQAIGGDVVNLLAYAITGNHKAYREAFAEAKLFLGIDAGKTHERPAQPRREPIPEKSKEDRRKEAYRVWKGARPIVGSLAEHYLRLRGIKLDLAPYNALRFHPAVRYDADGQREIFPALVAAVTGPTLRFLGIWRIYLAEDGQKAPVANPKLGMGPCKGGAVWLAGEGATVNVCEGLETGFGVRGLAGPKDRVACLLSTSGMRGWEPPSFVRSVLIWPDGDRDRIRVFEKGEKLTRSPGISAAEALKERLVAQGIACSIQPTPQNGKDALDLWNEWQALKAQEDA